jgi:acyl-CoA reductase-like NAD-dependent aldehyde dehydrogenase
LDFNERSITLKNYNYVVPASRPVSSLSQSPNFFIYNSNASTTAMPFLQDSTGSKVIPCIIGGKPYELPESNNFPITQASTGKVIHYAQGADVATAIKAADAAAKAFPAWSRTAAVERRHIINRFADILESKERFEDAKNRKMTETSAGADHGAFDVGTAIEFAREAAASITEACMGEIPANNDPNVTSLVFKEAIGPVLIIPP